MSIVHHATKRFETKQDYLDWLNHHHLSTSLNSDQQSEDRITHFASMKFDSVDNYKRWCKRRHLTTDFPD